MSLSFTESVKRSLFSLGKKEYELMFIPSDTFSETKVRVYLSTDTSNSICWNWSGIQNQKGVRSYSVARSLDEQPPKNRLSFISLAEKQNSIKTCIFNCSKSLTTGLHDLFMRGITEMIH